MNYTVRRYPHAPGTPDKRVSLLASSINSLSLFVIMLIFAPFLWEIQSKQKLQFFDNFSPADNDNI